MHLRRGRRVVDRRRQRADRDVDEHAQRERRILVDRALDAERDHAARLRSSIGVGVTSPCTCTSAAPRETKIADRVRQHEHAVLLPRPRDEAGLVDRLDRAGARAARDERGGPLGERPDLVVVRLPPRRRRDRGHAAQRVAARLRDERRHRDRPQPVDGAVEEDEEEHDRRGEEEAARGDAEVRDVVRILDAAQQREREDERPDQHGEHGLEAARRGTRAACSAPRTSPSPSARRAR